MLLTMLGLGLAAGGPWAYDQASTYWKSGSSSSSAVTAATVQTRQDEESRTPLVSRGLPADAVPNYDLADVLRFNITPGEVLARWPRVSTGMGQLELQGYRVLLVSGIAEYDLAGSLTYYFNSQQQCQRIAFYGTTGNPQRLVALLGQRFGFVRRIVNDPGVFLYEAPDTAGEARSVLHLQSAEVIRQAEPYRRYKLSLVIERPA